MSTYTYATIDGEKVESRVAADFEKMAAAFKVRFGLELLVTSGMRTDARQQELFDQGRTVVRPPNSNHNEGNPNGPRALDLRDSGLDLGVTRIGTVRSNWLRGVAGRYGFTLAGATFNPPEGWHYEYTKSITGGSSTPTPAPTPAKPASNKYGLSDIRGLQKVSAMYAAQGRATRIDNAWGRLSQEGFDRFLVRKYGNSKNAGLARWLRARWGYQGNNVYGPVMKAALKRANDANFKAL